jgi:translocation and assembly module TamB
LGVLQDINAEVRFNGRAAELASVTARMGGQPVMLQGRAELPVDGGPQLDLTLKGTNLPFVRRTGLLLRGDLDLTLKGSTAGRTAIGGTVRLRDSLFLADVRSLIPTGTKGSAARPPYFSIEAEPLRSWQLDVAVEGAHFLRLRTPVFNGTASINVRLEGTLGNPRATGEAVIDEGRVRLPFATFEVRQGHLRLTPDQAEPQLLVMGTTRRYGYDLRMELTGRVSAPELTFSSSPPLEAEQVLLLVMTGQAPNDEITTTNRQRVTRLGAFVGQSLLGSFAGDSGGADRLTISSGEDISAQGRETYSIEYLLSDRWALTGEYDEFDDYYGGLKWRIYPKEGDADERR